jgi:hypothetical protein
MNKSTPLLGFASIIGFFAFASGLGGAQVLGAFAFRACGLGQHFLKNWLRVALLSIVWFI